MGFTTTHSAKNMLSTTPSTTIAQRRQLHRRQQSLEVTMMRTPGTLQSQQPTGHQGHRRGMSLDHRLVQPRPLSGLRQQHRDYTNTGLHTDTQQFKQDAQQLLTSQPGLQALQLTTNSQPSNSCFNTSFDTPQVIQPNQQRALQELQHHLEWYAQTYGGSPTRLEAVDDINALDHFEDNKDDSRLALLDMPLPQTLLAKYTATSPTRPSSQSSRSQPFTPQWPSSPPVESVYGPSQTFRLDPSAILDVNANTVEAELAFVTEVNPMIAPVDAIESLGQINSAQMPTLFEESLVPSFPNHALNLSTMNHGLSGFNGAGGDFDFGIEVTAVSPRQALLNQLGSDLPASIVETGVASQEVQQYIGPLNDRDKKYPCLFPGCNKKFGRKENVRAHVQTHLGDRQFRCDVCEKTFVRQHDLKRHIAIHSDDRPHACICGQSFARHDALTRHRQRGMCIGALPGYEKDPAELPKRGRPRKERPSIEVRSQKASKQRRLNKVKVGDKTDKSPSQYAASSYSASERDFPVTPPDTSDAFDTDAYLSIDHGDNRITQFVDNSHGWKHTPPSSPLMSSPTKAVAQLRQAVQDRLSLDSGDRGISPSALISQNSSVPSEHTCVKSQHSSSLATFSGLSYRYDLDHDRTRSFDGCSSPADMHLFSDVFDGIDVAPDAVHDMFSPSMESHASSSLYNYSDCDSAVMQKKPAFSHANDVLAPSNNIFADLGPELAESHDMADMLNSWLSSN